MTALRTYLKSDRTSWLWWAACFGAAFIVNLARCLLSLKTWAVVAYSQTVVNGSPEHILAGKEMMAWGHAADVVGIVFVELSCVMIVVLGAQLVLGRMRLSTFLIGFVLFWGVLALVFYLLGLVVAPQSPLSMLYNYFICGIRMAYAMPLILLAALVASLWRRRKAKKVVSQATTSSQTSE